MTEKLDFEVRLLLTGHQSGAVDWCVVTHCGDGQVSWENAGTFSTPPGRSLDDPRMNEAVGKAVRSSVWRAVQVQFPRY